MASSIAFIKNMSPAVDGVRLTDFFFRPDEEITEPSRLKPVGNEAVVLGVDDEE